MTQRPIPARVQASEVTYELHTLGWKAFQDLCVTVVADVWGQTVQSYFTSHDGGRDGAFHGDWKHADGNSAGAFTVQCKFTSKADKVLTLSDLSDELEKAERLAKRGLAGNYLLFTNSSLTGVNEERIKTAFEATGIKRFAAYGRESISRLIRESPRLRMLVPRVYGLGDLSQIMDERAYAQAREILSSLGDDLRKFVITDAYQKSARALIDHGFVLLLGEAACGKSSIAAALSVGAIDEWGCSTIKVRNPEEFVRHSNPNEPKQFFWVDDAFGATQLDWQATVGWNSVFPHIQAAINRGAKVLFTSRDYIYRSARGILKQSALPLMYESQVVIQVEKLSKAEREQILYNHVRLGKQPPEFKRRIQPFLAELAAHPRFTPEIARRLGNPSFTQGLFPAKESLAAFVETPLEFTCEIIRNMDAESKAALGLVFMKGGVIPSPLQFSGEEEQAVALIGGTPAGVRAALGSLHESFVLRVLQGPGHVWKFKHPSIRDAFAALVATDPELLDVYLAGTPLENLMHEVSCGDLAIRGVKVMVPPNRYDALIDRLDAWSAGHRDRRDLHAFLSYRCDRAFLALYCRRHPLFIDGLHAGSYLYCVSDVRVLVRLHEFGLLPDPKRAAVVVEIIGLGLETPDSGCLREDVQSLFTAEESATLRTRLADELFPSLTDTITQWRGDYDPEQDTPEEHFDELRSALRAFRDEFSDHPDAVRQLREAEAEIKQVIEELDTERDDVWDGDDYQRDDSSHAGQDTGRSVFDDVAD
ncbi:MAG: hypothetical protein KF715_19575 [Candidatus Didemnitutus sp.]|nr:hypothetical protein [Candidatus Didemnitutus sp.]